MPDPLPGAGKIQALLADIYPIAGRIGGFMAYRNGRVDPTVIRRRRKQRKAQAAVAHYPAFRRGGGTKRARLLMAPEG